MMIPTAEKAHSAALRAASLARIIASTTGGGITAATNQKLGLALAMSNAGRFADAYKEVDKLADEQKAWIPCMIILRLAQSTFGNSAGPEGGSAPCHHCGASMPPVFAGERLCLVCAGGSEAISKTPTVSQA